MKKCRWCAWVSFLSFLVFITASSIYFGIGADENNIDANKVRISNEINRQVKIAKSSKSDNSTTIGSNKEIRPTSDIVASREKNHKVKILLPLQNGTEVKDGIVVEGIAFIPADEYLWVLAHINHPRFNNDWWPQGEARVDPGSGVWQQWVTFGEKRDIGNNFDIVVISVKKPEHNKLDNWVKKAKRTNYWGSPVYLPKTTSPPVYRTVEKTSH